MGFAFFNLEENVSRQYTRNQQDIRNKIVKAAQIYKNELMGKTFMYVFDGRYIEVLYQRECFLHLTGVTSDLYAKDFFNKAVKRILDYRQCKFDCDHPYDLSKKKMNYLHLLPQLTKERITVLEDFTTQSQVYKFAFMNYIFTLGLCENLDKEGKRKSDVYLPQSFRVEDDSNRKSKKEYNVKFILSKKIAEKVYTSLCYSDGSSLTELPESITQNIAINLIDEITNKKQ